MREGLILALASGAEYKSYMGAASAIALLVAVPAYARFADKVPRNRLIVGSTLFFASNLVLFWLGSAVPAVRARLGLVFYLWLGVFNMMVVAQFWSFANDLYREEQGKRFVSPARRGADGRSRRGLRRRGLSPRLGGRVLDASRERGPQLLTALLTQVVHTRESKRATPALRQSKPDTSGAFALVLSDRYLRLIAAFAVDFHLREHQW